MRKNNLTGKRFGRLVVTSQAEKHRDKNGDARVMWHCVCDCGSTSIIIGGSLVSGNTTSCGCFIREKRTTHRLTGSSIYRTYNAMLQRCCNPNNESYKNYGWRGITVCERWIQSFENFYEDMGESPEGKSLDRINNEKGYSKENCRWATITEQALNRRPQGKTSKLRGVSFDKKLEKFLARVKINGRTKYIGCLKTEYEAGLAYDIFVIKNGLPNMLNGGEILWGYKLNDR